MEEAFVQLTENGFQVRPAKLEDLPEAVPVFNAAEVELRGSGEWTVERYTNEWLEGGIDLETSTRIVIEPAGRIVGCVELWDIGNLPVSPWIWGRVHPDWKGHGIGSAMLDWAFSTSRRALERLPADARMAPRCATPSQHAATIALLEGAGMSVCRYTWRMVRGLEAPVPEPRFPPGILVRTLHYPDDLEAVFQAQEEAFSEHWGFVQSPFEEAFPRWKRYVFEALELKPELWFLALDGETIAGFINGQERSDLDAEMGYIPTLAVRKPYRRQGLGQALLQQAFRALQARGVGRVSLHVDAKNKTGATRLYERVGMHVDEEILLYEIELRPGRELSVVD